MDKNNKEETHNKVETIKEIHEKEELWTKRISGNIVKIILVVFIVLMLSVLSFVRWGLAPVDSKDTQAVEVTIPIGSTNRDVINILKENDIIREPRLVNIYMKFKNVSNLQAGYYTFQKSMSVSDVVDTLEAGGEPITVEVDTKITVVEGMQLEEIAKVVEEKTSYSAKDFMIAANNPNFIASLENEFQSLLSGLSEREGLKYPLEGYLYPATYDYMLDDSLESLIRQMVAKTNLEYQKLKQEDLDNTWLDFHQVLTLASIIEKEGITDEDRALIAGVFFNRMDAGMPLQSDITILYALGEHKELVTYADLEVDSPYNLYLNTGLTPGPVNSPSLSSIKAVIYPEYSNYYYFVADMETQKIYYAEDLETHESLVEEYVNPYFEKKDETSDESDENKEENEDDSE